MGRGRSRGGLCARSVGVDAHDDEDALDRGFCLIERCSSGTREPQRGLLGRGRP